MDTKPTTFRTVGATLREIVSLGRNGRFTPNGLSAPLEVVAEVALIAQSDLFDETWYRERQIVETDGLIAAVTHYVEVGALAGARPHPLFDVDWYEELSKDHQRGLARTPIGHFLCHGHKEGLRPSPLFDYAWYTNQAGVELGSNIELFRHFLREGAAAGASPHPLFDSRFYFEQRPSLGTSRVNPLTHYLECGALEGMHPNRYFDSNWYLGEYADVHGAARNPLVHFVRFGARSGYRPHPGVELNSIIQERQDLPRDPLQAYIEIVTRDLDDFSVETYRRMIVERDARQRRDDVASGAGCVEVAFQSDRIDLAQAPFIAADWQEPPIPDDAKAPPLLELAYDADLVSIDVWDTVLRRDCHPDEIKLQSARALLLLGYHSLRPAYRDLRSLLNARLVAEAAAAPYDDHEFRFSDALVKWLEMVITPGTDPLIMEELRRNILDHEFSAEERHTRLDMPFWSQLQQLKQPIVFASDFYMSSSFLEKLLDAKGMGRQFVRGYSSCDYYSTKRSGRLFRRIVSDFRVAPERTIHVGDNHHADYHVAKQLGLHAHLYENDGEHERREWYRRGLEAWKSREEASHSNRIWAKVESAREEASRGGRSSDLRAVGARLAPMFVGYALSILEDATKEKVDQVYFFTREGAFFQSVFDLVARARPFNLPAPKSELLEVSRRSTFAASLADCTPSNLMRLWNLYSIQSLKGLAVSLNLDESLIESEAGKCGLVYDEPITYPWENAGVRKLLANERVREHANEALARQRTLLLAYLKQKEFFSRPVNVISDIGWRGTIQDNIALLDQQTFVRGHYLGLFKYLNHQPKNTYKKGWLFDENIGAHLNVPEVAPLELLCMTLGGSVVGYRLTPEERMVAERVKYDQEEDLIAAEIAEFQAGVLDAAPAIADYVRRHGLMSEDLSSIARATADALANRPPAKLADAFFRLHHNETFGTGNVDSMACRGDRLSVALAVEGSAEKHAAVSSALAEGRWSQGTVRRSEVRDWWLRSPHPDRASVPLAIYSAHSPAIIRSLGTRLAVYAPPPLKSSGGHRTIYNVVRRLVAAGFTPQIFLEGIGAGISTVEDYLQGTSAVIHTEWHGHIASDVALATIAHSAKYVAELQSSRHLAYLVQDFEALFNPMSDAYLTAETSYALGLTHFTIGNWLTHVIRTSYDGVATPAGLGVDTSVYRVIDSQAPREKAICFLYQPDKPRRTPLLGIEALRRVREEIPETQIFVYGSDLPLHLDFPVTNLGLISDLRELNKLYNRCMVGLCISASNPSRIPYEMMAAGCVPVDLYRYNNLLDHSGGTIGLAHQDPDSLALAMTGLLQNAASTAQMSSNAQLYASKRTLDWEADVIANSVLSLLDGSFSIGDVPELQYADPPIIASNRFREGAYQFCSRQLKLAQVRRA